jgi:hypothetical protein
VRRPRPAEPEAAALRGGTEPDLRAEVAWWQTDDFWQYALYAAVAYIRAAAGRAGMPVRQVCQELAQRDGPRPGWASLMHPDDRARTWPAGYQASQPGRA